MLLALGFVSSRHVVQGPTVHVETMATMGLRPMCALRSSALCVPVSSVHLVSTGAGLTLISVVPGTAPGARVGRRGLSTLCPLCVVAGTASHVALSPFAHPA